MSWGMLSPEAQREMREARTRQAINARRLSCRLARTALSAVLMWPEGGGRQHREVVRRWVAKKLPAFVFNSRRNWWEAPLSELPAAAALLPAETLSAGVTAWLHEKGEI